MHFGKGRYCEGLAAGKLGYGMGGVKVNVS